MKINFVNKLKSLDEKKEEKMIELNKQCNITILTKRFPVTINGDEYWFSCDMEAQANFEKCDRAFEKGRIKTQTWTCYDVEGNVYRIDLDSVSFEKVYLGHLEHIRNNIAKLRDTLEPLVNRAKAEELKNISW